MEKTRKYFTRYNVMMGCDPEFFFERDGAIIGSEKVIDIDKGLPTGMPDTVRNGSTTKGESKFICDGVQVELNPRPDICRARLCNEISFCFKKLSDTIGKDRGIKANFSQTVTIGESELKSLDTKSQVFGCSPSRSTERKGREATIKMDATKYPYRSAGGHIHLGLHDPATQKAFDNPTLLVDVMDIVVGNTCVLIDRDPGNRIRRQVYGKAGEYRTPSYGVEYRTLSNFWLMAYPLASLVLSLSRLSVNIVANSTPENDYAGQLLKLVSIKGIRKAINENDEKRAMRNFRKIEKFLVDLGDLGGYEDFPVRKESLKAFRHFVSRGTSYWFRQDPLEHWASLPEAHKGGWETFLRDTVAPDMA